MGCSGLEQSEKARLMRANAVDEVIYRNASERFVQAEEQTHQTRALYAWEAGRGSLYPRITKEYFRCRGVQTNPPIRVSKERADYYIDCGGFAQHSLPLQGEDEFIYPRLIELLNYIQEEGKARVHITCGHRCPDHNKYAEPAKSSSYHMIGAEVDFYVDDLTTQEVVELLGGALNKPLTQNQNVWKNDEITIRTYEKNEGRDIDNNHEHPYISLQLRKHEGKPIVYTWQRAARGYLRW
jgi:hypothetical protein